MSYYEICQDCIKDLLLKQNDFNKEIFDDPIRGTLISNLATVSVTNQSEILQLV